MRKPPSTNRASRAFLSVGDPLAWTSHFVRLLSVHKKGSRETPVRGVPRRPKELVIAKLNLRRPGARPRRPSRAEKIKAGIPPEPLPRPELFPACGYARRRGNTIHSQPV